MQPLEALELLNKVLSNIQGTRSDHQTIETAVAIIRDALTEKPEVVKDAK